MKRISTAWIGVGTLGLALVVSGVAPVTSASAASAKNKTISIGLDQTLSGPIAFVGTPELDGAKYAVKVINETHMLGRHVTLKLNVYDDQATTQQGAINANAIVSSKDVAMFGPILSQVGIATTAITAKAKMLNVLTESSAVVLNSSNPNVYNLTSNGALSFTALAEYCQSQGVTSIAFVYDPIEANQPGLITEATPIFAKYGVTKVTSYSVDSTNNSTFVPTATAIISSGAQAVDFIQPDVGPALLKELKQGGFTGVTMSYTVPPALFASAGAAANGMVMPVSFTPLSVKTPVEAAFIKGYDATFKTTANANSAEAYDSILFIATAIKNAKSVTRAAIDKAASALVKSRAGFTGVEGHFKFTNREGNLPTILTIFGRLATPVAVVNP